MSAKKMKTLLAALAGVCCFGLSAAENPVYQLFPNDVIFHLSFDNGDCTADMAGGKAEPRRIEGKAGFGEGVFGGKALLTGRPIYDAAKNLDMTASGSIILWIAPVNWPTEKTADGKEPGFRAFFANAADYQFYIGKMSGQPWLYGGHLNNYVQYPKPTPHVNCIRYNDGTTAKWKNGEWRMLVATWGGGMFTNSVNGKKSRVSQLKKLMTAPTSWFQVGATENNGRYQFLTDEVVILKKALSDEEIQKLYEASLKALPRGK